MFRIWGKIFHENHMIRDTVVENGDSLSRTRKVFLGLEEICRQFDLSQPIWLDSNIREFQRISKTRFTADSFVEAIDFDYLEIQVIEEDPIW